MECGRCKGHRFPGFFGSDSLADAFSLEIEERRCPGCKGSGCVSNGAAERAEFIRVQCEIARMEKSGEPCDIDPHEGHTCCDDPCPVCASVTKYVALCKREQELLDKRQKQWFRIPGLYGPGFAEDWPLCWWISSFESQPRIEGQLRRGFIHTVRGPLAMLVGGPCQRHDWYAESRCPDCKGTNHRPGQLAAMGPELLVVQRAEATDVAAGNFPGEPFRWWDKNEGVPNDPEPADLPRELFEIIAELYPNAKRVFGQSGFRRCLSFSTRDDADDAISAGILALARRQAGLETTLTPSHSSPVPSPSRYSPAPIPSAPGSA